MDHCQMADPTSSTRQRYHLVLFQSPAPQDAQEQQPMTKTRIRKSRRQWPSWLSVVLLLLGFSSSNLNPHQFLAAAANSCSRTDTYVNNPLLIHLLVQQQLRGGGGKEENEDNEEEEDNASADATEIKDTEPPLLPSQPRRPEKTATSSLPLLVSLFQFNDLIKAETLAARDETSNSLSRSQRGGALVKQQQQLLPPPPTKGGIFAWLIPNNNNNKEKSTGVRQQAERFWWNNAWMDATSTTTHAAKTTIPTQPQHVEMDAEVDDLLETPQSRTEEEVDNINIVLEEEGEEKDDAMNNDNPPNDPIVPQQQEETRKTKRKRQASKPRDNNNDKDESSLVVATTTKSQDVEYEEEEEQEDTNQQLETTADDEAVDEKLDLDDTTISSDIADDSMAVPATSTPYTSSGAWVVVDNLLTLGFAYRHDGWKVSRSLRPIRKSVAYWTGMHGVLSGKQRPKQQPLGEVGGEEVALSPEEAARLAAIDRARGNVARVEREKAAQRRGNGFWRWGHGGDERQSGDDAAFVHNQQAVDQEKLRRQRVAEIDKLQEDYGQTLAELATEKELLLNIPNPLWNYTTSLEDLEEERRQQQEKQRQQQLRHQRGTIPTDSNTNETLVDGVTNEQDSSTGADSDTTKVTPQREFNFPSDDLVDEYLDMLFNSGRLVKLNHTELWRNNGVEDRGLQDEDDEEWLSAQEIERRAREAKRRGDAGSRWLRNGLGQKIGVAVEMVAYKAVCHNVMGIFAKSLSAMHGATVLGHSEICLQTEYIPVLPPLAGAVGGAADSYASQAFQNAIRKTTSSPNSKKKKRKRKSSDFVQRHAVAEQLLSQCQISTPLLKLFPLAWQRALIGNIITMITSILGDFIEGLEFEILGHKLSLVFKPITEQDMMKSLERSMSGDSFTSTSSSFYQHPARSLQSFEAAVEATTASMADSLQFLDRWHERVLGGDQIRTQVAALIARVVLSLIDDILTQSRMDLWSAHAGGPKLLAGLFYRTPASAPSIRHEISPSSAGSI